MLGNILCVNVPGCQADPYEHERMRGNIKKCRSGVGKKKDIAHVDMCGGMKMYGLGESRLIVDQSLGTT